MFRMYVNAGVTRPPPGQPEKHHYFKQMSKKTTFEAALERLEQITAELEQGEPSLDKSLKKFDEGVDLIKFCNQKLEEARKKVDLLMEKDGTLTSVTFPESDNGDQDLS